MHHALHKVVKRMGGQTTKGRGARGVRGVHTFLIAKNAPKLAAQTEFSQPQKDSSGSSKDGHGLKFEQLIVELTEMSVVKGKVFRASCCFIVEAHFCASNNFCVCAV